MRNVCLSLILCIALSGCTSNTKAGKCIGVLDTEQPGLKYEISVWNCFVGIFFSSTVVVPAIVVTKQYKCPVEN